MKYIEIKDHVETVRKIKKGTSEESLIVYGDKRKREGLIDNYRIVKDYHSKDYIRDYQRTHYHRLTIVLPIEVWKAIQDKGNKNGFILEAIKEKLCQREK